MSQQSPIQSGPGADASGKPGRSARMAELTNGLDTSNVAGLIVVGALLLLVGLSTSFGGLTVTAN